MGAQETSAIFSAIVQEARFPWRGSFPMERIFLSGEDLLSKIFWRGSIGKEPLERSLWKGFFGEDPFVWRVSISQEDSFDTILSQEDPLESIFFSRGSFCRGSFGEDPLERILWRGSFGEDPLERILSKIPSKASVELTNLQ
jgi:hypothetical protein